MAKNSFDFKTKFSVEIKLSISKCIEDLTRIDKSPSLLKQLLNIENNLISRFDNANASPPVINGKSLNPIVLGLFSRRNSFQSPFDLDPILKAGKEFSSFETAAGRIVEDVFPIPFGYSTVNTNAHDPFSEIDCAKSSKDITNLIALKSGPACINDTMSNKIGSAIGEHNQLWFERYKTKKIIFTIGMNYSTAKMSNKKDWHALRLAEEKLKKSGFNIESSCLVGNTAIPFLNAKKNGLQLTVQTLQGKNLWDYITESRIGFTLLVMALTRASVVNPNSKKAESVFTKNLKETIAISKSLNVKFSKLNPSHLEWFFLFARHFIDNFEE